LRKSILGRSLRIARGVLIALHVLLLTSAGGVLAGAPAAAQLLKAAVPEEVQAIEVQARQISRFKAANPSNVFGKLTFRGGLVLTCSSSFFGGLSGLVIEADGRRFLAVSDEGAWLAGEINYRDGAPAGIANARVGPIRAIKGRTLNKKRDLDAEGLALLSGNLTRGTVLISFERNHRIGVFPIQDGQVAPPSRYLKLPPEARRMRSNSGFEAVTVLRGGPLKGSIVAFSEQFPGDAARHVGWIWTRDVPQALTLADHGGFAITDAVSLDDGTLVLLERRFRWTEGVKMRLRRIEANDLRPGAALDGEVLLEADLSSEIDNMEGLAVHRGPGGETVLTLVSDNNFNGFLQRNLLLQFALTDGKAGGRE